MTQRAKTPKHSNHHTKTANKPSIPFGRWLAPAALAMLMLAVILTAGLQAPPPAQAHELDNRQTSAAQSPPAASCPLGYDDDPIPAEITFLSTTMTVGQTTETLSSATLCMDGTRGISLAVSAILVRAEI